LVVVVVVDQPSLKVVAQTLMDSTQHWMRQE
jgi:hypothetical protein